ncbi:MAG: hydroxyacid dehydrogenase [Chloroflexi bacterium]|nr:hydroxyacid dehydrogenase [Chloroflexota bacterium]
MKVLVADRISEKALNRLRRAGIEVVFQPDVVAESLWDAIVESRADVLVVRSTRVNAGALAGGRLKLVIRAGAGFNTIDVDAAGASGIYVSNCPGGNANAVVELAFGLILALDRHIPENVQDLRRGKWNKLLYSDGGGLRGRTLGLIGLGTIGRKMVPVAKAFGMDVVAWSRSLTPADARDEGVAMAGTPIEVASTCDIASVHVALNEDTRLLIGDDFFEAMKPGAMFINTARAEVVDEDALARAVRERGIRAGLDLFEGEPTSGTGVIHNRLFDLEGVIGTHHIGGQTAEAQQAIANETVRIILEYRDKGVPPNLVA